MELNSQNIVKAKENITAEFNEFSKNYTADMISCVPHYLSLLKAISKHLPKDFHPQKILDLGCGNGNVTRSLINIFPNSEYTLIDASSDMITLCKSQFQKFKVNYKECLFKDFNFPKNKYDLVVASFSLHHCQSHEKIELFEKIFNSLSKNGIFSSSDLMINKDNSDHASLVEEWKDFVLSNYPTDEKWIWLMDHYQTFDSPDNYFDQMIWLSKVGFKEISTPFRVGYWTNILALKS